MDSLVLAQLDRFGPQHCEQLDYEQAAAYTRDLVTSQYENFTVVSRLLPARLREHFAAVYSFCRWADDLGDETGDPARSLELLAWWRRELSLCYEGQPRHPVFVALHRTVEQFDIPAQPFEHLIDAFEQDQRVTRYATWDQTLDYCKRSADPVGRLVLYMYGYNDAQRQAYADATCTALQLANFWQDVRRDILERDRIYIPADVLDRHGLTHDDLTAAVRENRALSPEQQAAYRATLSELVERTWDLFVEGRKLLPMLRGPARMNVKLFTLGGEMVLRRIQKMNYNTLAERPALGKPTKVLLMIRALAGRLWSFGSRSGA
jgi:squalene synthase HpnC